MCERWVYTLLSLLCTIVHRIVSLGAVVMIIPPYTLYFGFFIDYFGLFWTYMVVM